MVVVSVGGRLRSTQGLLAAGGNENTMAPGLCAVLDELLPNGFKARFDINHSANRPDFTVENRHGGIVGLIEVKRPTTLHDAFDVGQDGQYQIGRYRLLGVPVLLTDGVRWWDVTDESLWTPTTFRSRLGVPFVSFADADSDVPSETALSALLHIVCGRRPRFSAAVAPAAMMAVIRRINSADERRLDQAWQVARGMLNAGTNVRADRAVLDSAQVGEIVAFTLLAVAANLDELDEETFVSAAHREWAEQHRWQSSVLPTALAACLRDFRLVDGETGGTLLGVNGWVTLRAVAAGLRQGSSGGLSWDKLSSLWDSYLGLDGQRELLGSWQTPAAVARFQCEQVSEVLGGLGYSGFADPNVTFIDPCCGTGVYLQEIWEQTVRDGGSGQGLNAPAGGGFARFIGSDLSPAAVAATHIRMSTLGGRPNLYMADTLAASPGEFNTETEEGAGRSVLFDVSEVSFDAALVRAVKRDAEDLGRWAGRDGSRAPVVAVIGNPPYGRNLLQEGSYRDKAWFTDCFELWRQGSGGGGALQDLYVAFQAWAFRLALSAHPSLGEVPFGVVSFITNRTWIDGLTFGPLRSWVFGQASRVLISDFGPGSRGGVADRWSEQPFAIEAGTAVVTVVFGGQQGSGGRCEVVYRKVGWVEGAVRLLGDPVVSDSPTVWVDRPRVRELFVDSLLVTGGVKSGADREWVRTVGDVNFGRRFAFRAFDNRFVPGVAPRKVARGVTPPPGFASGNAEWREKKLFNPHDERARAGGWYLVGQSSSVKPGPGLHATRYVPDYHFFKGSYGGRVLPVAGGTSIPPQWQEDAARLGVRGTDFWLLVLACAHHEDYWVEGTVLAKQLADNAVEPPLPGTVENARLLVEIGSHLVDLWSLDGVEPVGFVGVPGAWRFEGHNEVDTVLVHGRRVLHEWRKARPGNWDRVTATEYARTVAALIELRGLGARVAELVG